MGVIHTASLQIAEQIVHKVDIRTPHVQLSKDIMGGLSSRLQKNSPGIITGARRNNLKYKTMADSGFSLLGFWGAKTRKLENQRRHILVIVVIEVMES